MVGSSSSWWCSGTRGRIISWVNHKTTALDFFKISISESCRGGEGQLKHLHYRKIKTREQFAKNALPNLFKNKRVSNILIF